MKNPAVSKRGLERFLKSQKLRLFLHSIPPGPLALSERLRQEEEEIDSKSP